MGNWWLAASSQPGNVPAHASHLVQSFLAKHQITQVTQLPLQPNFGTLWLLDFPQTKITLKGKTFQTISEIQENSKGQLMAIGRTVWSPNVPTLKRTEASLSYVQRFLYHVSSLINVSIFHIRWLDTFLTDYTHMHSHTDTYVYVCTHIYMYMCEMCGCVYNLHPWEERIDNYNIENLQYSFDFSLP